MSFPVPNEPEPAVPVPSGIVVTGPSSPQIQPPSHNRDVHRFPFPTMPSSPFGHSFETDALRVPTPRPPLQTQDEAVTATPEKSHFEKLMDSANLPEPGPEYFEARRLLWHTPSPHYQEQNRSTPPNRRRLEDILQKYDGRLDEDEIWSNGLDKVWKGLITGARLKLKLPLRYLVSVVLPVHSL